MKQLNLTYYKGQFQSSEWNEVQQQNDGIEIIIDVDCLGGYCGSSDDLYQEIIDYFHKRMYFKLNQLKLVHVEILSMKPYGKDIIENVVFMLALPQNL